MPDLFSVPIAELTLDQLQEFLNAAEPEPLLWEAKGGDPDPHEVRKQCGGFANSNRGGYLLLGVHEGARGWAMPGMAFPDQEPPRFITSCLQEGVRPIPSYDVRALQVGHDRHVAIIEIEPLAAGPCIVRGTVYERVAGATVPVKDPLRLADLFQRGERAHAGAQRFADEALGLALVGLPDEPPSQPGEDEPDPLVFVALAVAAVDPPADVSAVLFRASTRERMLEVLEPLAAMPYPIGPTTGTLVSQDRRIAWIQTPPRFHGDWSLNAFWTGAVSVGYRLRTNSLHPGSVVESVVVPGFRAAGTLLTELGTAGSVYLRISIVTDETMAWPDHVRLDRGPVELTADALDSTSIVRELNRALGIDDPEPE